MSYLLQAAIFLPLGILLAVALLPIGGIVIAVLSVIMLAVGASNNDPGNNAGLCGWLGHD